MTSLIKHHAAADAIAAMLADGVQHPGDPETNQQPARLNIPMFRVQGKPPPYADAAKAAGQTIAEAVVYLIENTLDCSIVPNSELEAPRE